jgi:hypothetical protein
MRKFEVSGYNILAFRKFSYVHRAGSTGNELRNEPVGHYALHQQRRSLRISVLFPKYRKNKARDAVHEVDTTNLLGTQMWVIESHQRYPFSSR